MIKSKIPNIFLPALVIGVVIIAVGVTLYINGHKYRSSFDTIRGKVIGISHNHEGETLKDQEKYRYIQIEGYPKTLELFIGKDMGEAEPELEKIDSLKINDEIIVYYKKDNSTASNDINRLVQFIDKGNKTYFIVGGQNRYFGYFVIGCGGAILALLLYLKSKRKIE